MRRVPCATPHRHAELDSASMNTVFENSNRRRSWILTFVRMTIGGEASAPLPLRRPFIDERGHAFLLVLAAEQAVEQTALEDDPLGETGLISGVDQLLGG